MTGRLEKQAKKSLLYAIFGIIGVITLLVIIGVPLFITFADFIARSKEEEENSQAITDNAIIAPPFLDQTFEATNSAKVKITGSALEKQEITLYINEDIEGKTKTKADGSFEFKNVVLQEGQNIIKAKAATEKGKKSNYSSDIRITYLKNQPSLSIDSPPEGQAFAKDEKTITVTGKTDKDVVITVNGFRAVVDTNGTYSYRLELKDGENEIKVKATDIADNSKEEARKVTYSP